MVAEVERPCGGDRDDHCEQDARDPRPPALDDQDQRETDQADRCSGGNRLARREPVDERACLVDQPVRVGREPKSFGSCPIRIVSASPFMYPICVGLESRSAMNPSFPSPRRS